MNLTLEEVTILTNAAGRRFKKMYGTDDKTKEDDKPGKKTRTFSMSDALNKKVI